MTRKVSRDAKCRCCGATENMRTDVSCNKCSNNRAQSATVSDQRHFLCEPEEVENIMRNSDYLKIKLR